MSKKPHKHILWGDVAFDSKTLQSPDVIITGMFVDSMENMVTIVMQKGKVVDQIKISMQEAQRIGLIDFTVLQNYC